MESKLSSSMGPSDIHIQHSSRDEIIRPSADFAPSLWDNLLPSMVHDDQIISKCSEEHNKLKTEMSCMLSNESISMEEKLTLIDVVERLGISYLFKNEIDDELKKIHASSFSIEMINKQDLTIVSLYFRLLRQYGFQVSSEIFDGFKDKDGFKNLLSNDVKGLLNLFEAAHIRINGEDVLEEALAFSSMHLKLLTPHLPPLLSKRCAHTLVYPIHRSHTRIVSRFYISLYEEDDSIDELVLRLAKLDFALLQNLHRKELGEIARWWKDTNMLSKYPYIKDRLVELYFWVMGMYFEPEYSLGRVLLARNLLLITVIDDTYDSYGTLDELKAFTQAVERWDINEIDRLPEYMKHLYKVLLQVYVSHEEELQPLQRSYAVSYSKERMIEEVQNSYIEATWLFTGHNTPSFQEYLKHALCTTGHFMLTTTSLFGMESATIEDFEWLKTNPKTLVASATICRLVNDLAGYEEDKRRGQITTGIDCYIKQYGVTKEKAMDEMSKMVENAWKDLNEGCLRLKGAAHDVILNLARLGETYYKHRLNGLNDPNTRLMAHIVAVLVDTIEI